MRASCVLAAGLLGACFSDPADVPFTYEVGGTVAGMWDGASITLHLEAGDVDETLTVDANGAFTFATKVPEQTAFTITLEDEPAGHDCTAPAGGMIENAAIDDLEVTCTGPAVDIALSAPIVWTFDSNTLAYALDVSTLTQETAVTVTSADASAIRLDDADLADATPSVPVALALGANTLTVEVEAGDAHRTFTIALERGAAEIEQYVYGKASNSGVTDAFGTVIAASGDTLVVGAPFEDSNAAVINGAENNNNAQDTGAVYVLRRSGTTWAKEAYIKAPVGLDDHFGAAVAIDQDTLVVGVPGDDGAGDAFNDRGAAFVFHRSGTTWTQEAFLRPSNAADTEGFGTSVAVSGDVAAIGSIGSVASQGSVYLYRRSGTTWPEEDRIQGSVGSGGDNFGYVALDGDRLVVGASALGAGGNRAYVFEVSGGSWEEQAILLPLPGTPGLQLFGLAVAIESETIIVSATGDSCNCRGIDPAIDNTGATFSGAVYVFTHDANGWSHQSYIKASNADQFDQFGGAVAIKGDLMVVGARDESGGGAGVDANPDDNSRSSAGAAYVFRRDGSTWTEERYLKPSNPDVDDDFGASVAIVPDGAMASAPAESSAAAGLDGDDTDNSAPGSGAMYIFR